jgi:hypothetical protein
MKKILVLLTLLVFTFVSCRKEKSGSLQSMLTNKVSKKERNFKGISYKFDRTTFAYKSSGFAKYIETPIGNAPWVVFESCEEYEFLIDTLDANDKATFVGELESVDYFFSLNDAAAFDPGYTIVEGDTILNNYDPLYDVSFAKENADSIDNDFFGEILNPDGVVQIGDFILKINAITGQCYVLEAANIFSFADLISENTGNEAITEYSNDDDVLDILFGEEEEQQRTGIAYRLFCNEGGANDKKDNANEYYSIYGSYQQIKLECKVVYQKAAIYFALVSKMEYMSSNGLWWTTNNFTYDAMTAYYQYKWKPKCKSEHIQSATSYVSPGDRTTYSVKPYENTKGLNKYDFQFQWGVTGDEATNHTYKLTRVYRITSGY